MNNLKNNKIMIAFIIIATVALIGIILYYQFNSKTSVQLVSAEDKKLNSEEEVILEVKEEIVSVAVDNSVDEELIEKENKEVTFDGMTVTVPKSTVASPKAKDDPENSKKKGGSAVSQADTATMFENTGVKSYGIDISSWQGNINWAAVKASGIDFAIIRCGYRGFGSGAILEDAYFKQNVTNATANGVKVGVYFYSAAVNETEALEEAIWIIQKISTYRITYPVVYDCEEVGVAGHRTAGVTGAQATSNAHTFLNYVQSMGYEPMLYANKSDIGKMGRGNFSCKFWLAHYTSNGQPTDYTGSHHMWQYTSAGSVPGISGKVDMNVAYFSYGATANAKHTHNFAEVVRNSHIDATCTTDGKEIKKCSCGETEEVIISKTGHKFGNWEVKTLATTENEGQEVRMCSVCHTQETRSIAKLQSNTNTNANIGNNTNSSTDTGNTTTSPENHEHKWKDVILEKADCGTSGIKQVTCSECGNTKPEETIPATGKHNYENGICTVCGVKDPNYKESEEPPVVEGNNVE